MSRSFKKFVRKNHRTFGISSWQVSGNLLVSFKYAFQGIMFGLNTQRNFRIHLLMATIVFVLGISLKLDFDDLAILVFTSTLVIVLELLNTSIESVVNLSIGRRFHPLAKASKDCAAASVLVASMGALLIACLLLLPPIITQMGL